MISPVYGLTLVVAALGAMALAIAMGRRPSWATRWLLIGFGLRIVGSMAYLFVAENTYGGGDYNVYFGDGVAFSEQLLGGPKANLFAGHQWWGTSFVSRLAGIVMVFIGPTRVGTFLVFSVVCYIGSVALWIASCRGLPYLNNKVSLTWLMAFPSLWFWPSALGKDAVVLFGVGLSVLGFVGKNGRVSWMPLVIGIASVFVIRPQVAAVLVLALSFGQVVGSAGERSGTGIVRGVVLAFMAVAVVAMASGALGFELFDVDATADYVESRASATAVDRGAIEEAGSGAPIWMAPITTLFRPFLWEANGVTGLMASIEIYFMWIYILYRHRRFAAFWLRCRNYRLFWMGFSFVALYSVALGLSVGNLGILARQRVHIMPFILLPLAAVEIPVRRLGHYIGHRKLI